MAGASLIAVHGRQRGRVDQRRDGAADLSVIREVKSAIDRLALPVHLLTNGNVRTRDDLHANVASTQADGIMVAEAVSRDPSLFSSTQPSLSPLQLARRYVRCVEECGGLVDWSEEEVWMRVVGHIDRMAGEQLMRYGLGAAIERPCSLSAISAAVDLALQREGHEARGEWRAEKEAALEAEWEGSRERRQRWMEVIRGRERKRQRLGLDGDCDDERLTLNSKQRARKRKKAAEAAHQL